LVIDLITKSTKVQNRQDLSDCSSAGLAPAHVQR